MKSVIFSGVIIVVVIVFVTLNTIFLDSFFSSVEDLLDKLPQRAQELENMTQSSKEKYTGIIDDAIDKWKDKEIYLSVVISHSQAGQFSDTLLPLKYYFESEDYKAFCANLEMAKNILERIRQNESISIGTIF